MNYTLWHGDCLEEMDRIENRSIDCILADLPYNVTNCHWDTLIPFEPLWKQYKRVIKKNGAVVLFGSQPFTTLLIASSPEFGTKKQWFKYPLVWIKSIPTGFWNAKRMPMKIHEDILVFYQEIPVYNPQMVKRTEEEFKSCCRVNDSKSNAGQGFGGKDKLLIRKSVQEQWYKYPTTEIKVALEDYKKGKGHPTQKPVALLSYLIKTYTNEGETVLDNTCGSGSTLEAAMRCNRHSIGIEKDAHYFSVAQQRLERVAAELRGELNHLPMFAEAIAV